MESEFSDHHGRLYVIPLRSGKYFLLPFLEDQDWDASPPMKADFEVRSHETVYLGEFYMPQCDGAYRQIIQDQEIRDRDLALLKAKNLTLLMHRSRNSC